MACDSGINSTYEILHAIVENLHLVSGKIPNSSAVATLKGISIQGPENAYYDGREQKPLHGKACAGVPFAKLITDSRGAAYAAGPALLFSLALPTRHLTVDLGLTCAQFRTAFPRLFSFLPRYAHQYRCVDLCPSAARRSFAFRHSSFVMVQISQIKQKGAPIG
jgi:hypothetical protein